MPKGVDHGPVLGKVILGLLVQKSLMPKGVDHSSSSGGTVCVCRVQKSLMPKGVDHLLRRFPELLAPGAKIFDAERR